MPNPRLASRYAKSLIDLAVERGQLEVVYKDMLYLKQITDSSRDFLNLLRSPVISADKKTKIIKAVVQGHIGELTDAFVQLLVNKGRESNLPEVITSFIQQYKKIKNIHTVTLTTAVPVSDAVRNAIVAQIKQTSNMQNIELQAKVDEAIIGGFIIQAGDKMVDASIAYDLKEISRQFENNDFIYKVR